MLTVTAALLVSVNVAVHEAVVRSGVTLQLPIAPLCGPVSEAMLLQLFEAVTVPEPPDTTND